jgi:hypothetical protein
MTEIRKRCTGVGSCGRILTLDFFEDKNRNNRRCIDCEDAYLTAKNERHKKKSHDNYVRKDGLTGWRDEATALYFMLPPVEYSREIREARQLA